MHQWILGWHDWKQPWLMSRWPFVWLEKKTLWFQKSAGGPWSPSSHCLPVLPPGHTKYSHQRVKSLIFKLDIDLSSGNLRIAWNCRACLQSYNCDQMTITPVISLHRTINIRCSCGAWQQPAKCLIWLFIFAFIWGHLKPSVWPVTK